MGDQRREPSVAEFGGSFCEESIEALERRLEQHPSGAWLARARSTRLVLGEARDHPDVQLAAGLERQRNPLAPQMIRELAGALVDLGRMGDVQGVDVRRNDHGARAVRDRGCGQRDALLHAARSVIDAGEEVEMEFDETQVTSMIRGPHLDSVTIQ